MALKFDIHSLNEMPGKLPVKDGESIDYVNAEVGERHGIQKKPVLFINGMGNTPANHKQSALALSFVRFSHVKGFYNQSAGVFWDLVQCLGDKNQFDGIAISADRKIRWSGSPPLTSRAAVMRKALGRNAPQVTLFDYLFENRALPQEIYAHSQGNLILSNVLQAFEAACGPGSLANIQVTSFGSPSVFWPSGLKRIEMAYTFDPVSWLSGVDLSFSVSKLGMPYGSYNPISHAFLQYLSDDPAFIVNRFRTGGWGITFNMDEHDLAGCLAEMKNNAGRVLAIFEYLERNHTSDADDVAMIYTDIARRNKSVEMVIRSNVKLKALLIRTMRSGWTGSDETAAIAYLNSL